MSWKNGLKSTLVFAAAFWSLDAYATTIHLSQVPTVFNNPIGIDFHEPSGSLALSVNYSSGQPRNFELVQASGAHVGFSNAAGFTEEVKIATVRSGGTGGFNTGDLFTGNGVDGQIARISSDGSTVQSPWVDLPGDGNGLMRGSLYVDRTDVFGGDLIAATTTGQVWRVDSAGNPTLLASLGVHLEGLSTIPNSSQYGPLAGRIIAGAEGVGLLYTIDALGNVASHNVGVAIEDIDIINANENFFGVNFGTGHILTASAADFSSITGEILLTQEIHSGSGLFRLFWNGASLQTEELLLTSNSAPVGQWEHVTFAPFRVAPEPGTLLLLAAGLTIAGVGRRRRA